MKKINYPILVLLIIIVIAFIGIKESFEEKLEDPCMMIKDDEYELSGDVVMPKRPLCYSAIERGDTAICSSLEISQENCVTYIAIKRLDEGICQSINNKLKVIKCEKAVKQIIEQSINSNSGG